MNPPSFANRNAARIRCTLASEPAHRALFALAGDATERGANTRKSPIQRSNDHFTSCPAPLRSNVDAAARSGP